MAVSGEDEMRKLEDYFSDVDMSFLTNGRFYTRDLESHNASFYIAHLI